MISTTADVKYHYWSLMVHGNEMKRYVKVICIGDSSLLGYTWRFLRFLCAMIDAWVDPRLHSTCYCLSGIETIVNLRWLCHLFFYNASAEKNLIHQTAQLQQFSCGCCPCGVSPKSLRCSNPRLSYTVVHRVSAHERLLLEAEKSGGERLHAWPGAY